MSPELKTTLRTTGKLATAGLVGGLGFFVAKENLDRGFDLRQRQVSLIPSEVTSAQATIDADYLRRSQVYRGEVSLESVDPQMQRRIALASEEALAINVMLLGGLVGSLGLGALAWIAGSRSGGRS